MTEITEIFVITIDDVDDFATLPHEPEAFRSYDDARSRFNSIVADAKHLFKEYGWEVSVGEDSFETWPDGQWGTEHYAVYIHKIDLF